MNDGAEEIITSIAIRFGGETVIVVFAGPPIVNPIEVGGQDFTVTRDSDGMSVVVDGLVTGVTIATYTADGFNSLEVTYVSGNPFIITGFGTSAVLTDPVSFEVPVELVDGDGDTTTTSSINVNLLPEPPTTLDASGGQAVGTDLAHHVLGTSDLAETHFIGSSSADFVDGNAFDNFLAGGDGNDTLMGLLGNDTLVGQAGDDTLRGGAGNDILNGGAGMDRMLFGAGEVGLANQDIINTYAGTGADRDIIDLSGLLDATFNGGTISSFVRVDGDGTNSIVQIDVTGTTNFTAAGNVATLSNYGTINSIVTLYFEGAEHQVPVV